MARTQRQPKWRIQYFQRHVDDDVSETCPTRQFLDAVPPEVAAEFLAILEAVAEAPPPSFSGGGKWEAMHGDMAGFYEARVGFKGINYRLLCVLVREPKHYEGPAIVCIGGLQKPVRSPAPQREYRAIRRFLAEHNDRFKVLE
jgi:hypothetical protein